MRDRNRLIFGFAVLLAMFPAFLATGAKSGWADEPEATAEKGAIAGDAWIRLERKDKNQPIALQTAIVRYQAAEGNSSAATVDLIAAIHVGDEAYYDQLNEEFKQYDALLYELVAPKGTKVPKGRGASGGSGIGAMQNGMKNLLKLEHQLDKVDYTPGNFVHADMTPTEFSKKMEERGESFLKLFFRIMGESMSNQGKNSSQVSDFELIAALFSKDRSSKLKSIMAEQFAGMETMMVSLGGPDGSTIITERNKVALDVLKAELASGKQKIGIFYGAGHMKDMDERLRKDFQLAPTETKWITAWDLQAQPPKP